MKLYEFMSHIDRAMSRLRNNEMKDDFDSSNQHPVLVTHLLHLEKQAAEVYTRNTFAWVRDEIKLEAKHSIVNCVPDIDSMMYTFKKFDGGDQTWNVRYTPTTNMFICSCKMFETIGIPCCHAFSVMKAMNQHRIPETLVMQRWIMNVKDVEVDESSTATTPHQMQMARSTTHRCYFSIRRPYFFASHAMLQLIYHFVSIIDSTSIVLEMSTYFFHFVC